MVEKIIKQCSTCCYSFAPPFEGGESAPLMCRRYPPKVAPMQSQNQLTGEVQIGAMVLPVNVADDYFCGEWVGIVNNQFFKFI